MLPYSFQDHEYGSMVPLNSGENMRFSDACQSRRLDVFTAVVCLARINQYPESERSYYHRS